MKNYNYCDDRFLPVGRAPTIAPMASNELTHDSMKNEK